MKTNDEKEIIEHLKDPKTRRRAFEQMVNLYNRTLYWQIRHIVTDHDDADDVLQNTFLKAWNSIEYFRGDSKLSTWLYKIAYNESITLINSRRQTLSLDDADPESPSIDIAADSYFDGDETQQLLQEAIDILPAKQKAVFTMKYYDEMKYEDMSDITGTSVGALKASYHLAVEKITNFVKKREIN